jgi:hypothetical protein
MNVAGVNAGTGCDASFLRNVRLILRFDTDRKIRLFRTFEENGASEAPNRRFFL